MYILILLFVSNLLILSIICFLFFAIKNFFYFKITGLPIKEIVLNVPNTNMRRCDFIYLFELYLENSKISFEEIKAQCSNEKERWFDEEIDKINFSKLFYFRKKYYETILEEKCDDNVDVALKIICKDSSFKHTKNNPKQIPILFITFDELSSIYKNISQRKYEKEQEKKYKNEIEIQKAKAKEFVRKQRNLMTKELRESIAKRDNYTCQICGKYMPDGVGLQIDHIIPLSKGGTSDSENLQVLCSKCNSIKSNKVNFD